MSHNDKDSFHFRVLDSNDLNAHMLLAVAVGRLSGACSLIFTALECSIHEASAMWKTPERERDLDRIATELKTLIDGIVAVSHKHIMEEKEL